MDHSQTPQNLPSPTQNVEPRCSSTIITSPNTQCTSVSGTIIPWIELSKDQLSPCSTNPESISTSKDQDGSWSEIGQMDTWQPLTMWNRLGNAEEVTLSSGNYRESMLTSELTSGEDPCNNQISFGCSTYHSSKHQHTPTVASTMMDIPHTNSETMEMWSLNVMPEKSKTCGLMSELSSGPLKLSDRWPNSCMTYDMDGIISHQDHMHSR